LETLSSLYIRHDGSVPFTGKQSMGGFNLTNVLDPIGNQDAATKSYVDALPIYNASYWTGTNYNASYWTGTNYNASYLNKDGTIAMTGNLNLGSKQITSLITGSTGDTAVNKSYVDALPIYNASYWTGTNYNASYYLRDASLSLTGQNIFRNVSNSNLNLFGGTTGAGKGGIVSVEGSDSSSNSIVFYVPDATKTTDLIAAKFVGVTSLPYLDMMITRQIKRLADPTDPQDAATKSYVDSKSVTFTLCSNLSMIYPINVVMITTNNVSPATSLGCGNWSSLGTGYALVGI